MKKAFWRTANLTGLSRKAMRFFEESDQQALDDLFGDCNSLEDIENAADEMYDEFFGEED